MRTIELNPVDIRYLKLVDHILEVNKELGILPDRENQLSLEVCPGMRGFLSSVKNKNRHVPVSVIELTVQKFEFNTSFLFKDDEPIGYMPHGQSDAFGKTYAKHMATALLSKKQRKYIQQQRYAFTNIASGLADYGKELSEYLELHQEDIAAVHRKNLMFKIRKLEGVLEELLVKLESVLIHKETEIAKLKKSTTESKRRQRKKYEDIIMKDLNAIKSFIIKDEQFNVEFQKVNNAPFKLDLSWMEGLEGEVQKDSLHVLIKDCLEEWDLMDKNKANKDLLDKFSLIILSKDLDKTKKWDFVDLLDSSQL